MAKEEKIIKLAESIWNSVNEIDYDPCNSNFENLDDFMKGSIIEFSKFLIYGNIDEKDKEIRALIEQAHMSGQSSAGVDPSAYEAMVYANEIIAERIK